MSLTTTKAYLSETAKLLTSLPERRDLLEALVEIGSELPDYPSELEIQENYVPGCASNVWIHCKLRPDGRINIQGKSEALIVRGFVKILVDALSGLTPDEIQKTQQIIEEFVSKTKISSSTLATRANSFGLIYEKILSSVRS